MHLARSSLQIPPKLVWPLLACLSLSAQAEVTCCFVQGKRICGDPAPLVCLDKARVIYEKGGRIKRELEPPPPPEERERRLAEEAKRKEEAQRAEEQRRRDHALLASYASVEEIDRLQKRRLAAHQRTLDEARERLAAVEVAYQKQNEEKGALAGKPIPPAMAKQLADYEAEIDALRAVIARTENEIEAVKRRFEEEKARFRELKSRPSFTR
ncbi:MAG: hypothetical protein N2441_09705 [Rhodocyclaceae bacterium]|nr:hypothetical protein [Rhodocyclaceae bacterium]